MYLPLIQKSGKTHITIDQKRSKTIPLKDIIMCEGYVNYTLIYMHSGQKILIAHTLKYFEKTLVESGFSRVHRKYLINYSHSKGFDSNSKSVIMENGIEVSVSRRRLNDLRSIFSKNT